MKRWLATRLHNLADRIHPDTAFRNMGWSFTYEVNRGVVFNDKGRGCRLWYYGHAEHDRAHTESLDPPVRIDWAKL